MNHFLSGRIMQDECSICTEAMGSGPMPVKLPCDHWYHGPCIRPWLLIQNTCPVCRCTLNSARAIAAIDQVTEADVTDRGHPFIGLTSYVTYTPPEQYEPPRSRSRSPEISLDSPDEDGRTLTDDLQEMRDSGPRYLPSEEEGPSVRRRLRPRRRVAPISRRARRPAIPEYRIPQTAIPMGTIRCPVCDAGIESTTNLFIFTCHHMYHVTCAAEMMEPLLNRRHFNTGLRVHNCPGCLIPSVADRTRLENRLEEMLRQELLNTLN